MKQPSFFLSGGWRGEEVGVTSGEIQARGGKHEASVKAKRDGWSVKNEARWDWKRISFSTVMTVFNTTTAFLLKKNHFSVTVFLAVQHFKLVTSGAVYSAQTKHPRKHRS